MMKLPLTSSHSSFSGLLLLGMLLLGVSVGGAGCSSGKDKDGYLDPGGKKEPGQVPCLDGTQRSCGATLNQSHGVVTCYRGTQQCKQGAWGPCQDGEISQEVDASWFSGQTSRSPWLGEEMLEAVALSESEPEDCVDVCDPRCLSLVEPAPRPQPKCEEHNLCTVGEAFDQLNPCDECVTTVCAVDSSCCVDAWDSTCVDLAFRLCLNQPPPVNFCEMGVFSGTGVTFGNHVKASPNAGIVSNGNAELGTDASPSFIRVRGDLRVLSPNATVVNMPGGAVVSGNVSFDQGNATYTGDWQIGGNLSLLGNSYQGDLFVGGNVTASNEAKVLLGGAVYAQGTIQSSGITADPGALHPGSELPKSSAQISAELNVPTEVPTREVTCPGGEDLWQSGGTLILPPGDYGEVRLSNNATLILEQEGAYTFTRLEVSDHLRLGTAAHPATDAGWDVSVCGDFRMQGASGRVMDSDGNTLQDASQLLMYVTGDAYFTNEVHYAGILWLPQGEFSAGNNVTLKGAVWANRVQTDTYFSLEQMDEEDCLKWPDLGDLPEVVSCPFDDTDTNIMEYEYRGVCLKAPGGEGGAPLDTESAPRWKTLTWSAITPDDAQVRFYAQVASDVAQLNSSSYVLVGTAQQGPPDTQECGFVAPSGSDCPVLMGDKLQLGPQQGEILGLRVELVPSSSGDLPTVENWDLRYTCAYDQ